MCLSQIGGRYKGFEVIINVLGAIKIKKMDGIENQMYG